jgi:gamma-glutamylputrescine oxidase
VIPRLHGGARIDPTTSYWLEEPTDGFARRASTRRVEVAVVGGGVTGCSCALSLAQRGVGVRLYEARAVAGGASGRNGGFALRGGAAAYDRARTQLGSDQARALWELTERTLDRLERLAGNAFRRAGSLRLAVDDAERDALEAEFVALRDDGFEATWIEPLGTRLDRLFRAAILHPRDGSIQPARWVRRLARHAVEAGAEIVERSQVDDFEAVDADAVVVAADGFTAAALPELADAVWPVRGQVLVTEPLPERIYDRPHYSRDGYDYWQQLSDGRLVVGGKRDASLETENTSVEETTPLIQERLEQFVGELLGRVPRITHRWAGVWGSTPDLLPLVGRVPGRGNVWVAGGYSGHGNVLGLACGDLVARAVVGEAVEELALFDPARFR